MGTGSVNAPSNTFKPTTGANDITITVAGDDIVNKDEAGKPNVPVTVKVTPQNGETVTDVTVTVNGKPYKATKDANGDGYTAQVPSADIKADTAKTATAKVTLSKADKTGTATDTETYTVDTVAPAKPTTPDMTAQTDTGVSNKDNNTSNNKPSFTVQTPADGETPVLMVDGNPVEAEVTKNNGTTTLTPKQSIPDGDHKVSVAVTDSAGNTSEPSGALSITIDTEAPTKPEVTIGNGDDKITNDEVDKDGDVTIKVKLPSDAKAGDTVVINGDNGIKETLTDDHIKKGKVEVKVKAPGDGIDLVADVLIKDKAGNQSESDSETAQREVAKPSKLSITTEQDEVAEGGTKTFTVTREGDTSKAVTVDWTVKGSGANPADADDFATPMSGNLTIDAGKTTGTISISTNQDSDHEGNENFTVTLTNPTNAVLGDAAAANGIIVDDDPAPSVQKISIADNVGLDAKASGIPGTYTGEVANQGGAVINTQARTNDKTPKVTITLDKPLMEGQKLSITRTSEGNKDGVEIDPNKVQVSKDGKTYTFTDDVPSGTTGSKYTYKAQATSDKDDLKTAAKEATMIVDTIAEKLTVDAANINANLKAGKLQGTSELGHIYIDANKNGRYDTNERVIKVAENGKWQIDTKLINKADVNSGLFPTSARTESNTDKATSLGFVDVAGNHKEHAMKIYYFDRNDHAGAGHYNQNDKPEGAKNTTETVKYRDKSGDQIKDYEAHNAYVTRYDSDGSDKYIIVEGDYSSTSAKTFATYLGSGNDFMTVSSNVREAVKLFMEGGNDTFALADNAVLSGSGTNNPYINMGAGDDIVRLGGINQGSVELGAGNDTMIVKQGVLNGLITGESGNNTIDIMGQISRTTMKLGVGNDKVTIGEDINGFSSGANTNINLGGGDDILTASRFSGSSRITVDGGAGVDVLNLTGNNISGASSDTNDLRIKNIEIVNLKGSNAHVNLDGSQLKGDSITTLYINSEGQKNVIDLGDNTNSSRVNLGGFRQTGTNVTKEDAKGVEHTYNVYTYENETVYIENNITVI